MKKVFVLAGFVFVFSLIAQSQEAFQDRIRMMATNQPPAEVLIMVDSFETNIHSLVISPNNIQEVKVLKGKAATDLFGEKAKMGAVVIKTKSGTTFQRITDFVDSSKNLNCSIAKIQLNGVLLPDMNQLLIDRSALTNTMISAQFKTDDNPSPTDKLIITTRFANGNQ